MDAQHLMNVLGMLRMLKGKIDPQDTAAKIIRRWCGSDISDAAVLRVAAHLFEEIRLAAETLNAAQLSTEVKEGIIPKLDKFAEGFTISSLQANFRQYCPDVPGMITTIAVVVEASGIPPTPEPPSEVQDLIKDVLDLVKGLSENLDPIVASTIRQHAQILVALLQNLQIFGADIALASYYELIAKVKRADACASDQDKKATKPLLERLQGWGSALKSIHEIWDSSTKIINQAEAVITPLLTHIPK